LDALEVEFHKRVRQGDLEMARKEPRRWVRIDTEKDEEAVWAQILNAVAPKIGTGRGRGKT
jgi:dTMP kinase